MADTKISNLTDLNAAPAATDQLVVNDVSDTTMAASGTTKRLDVEDLFTSITVKGGTWGPDIRDLRGDQLGYAAVGGNLTPGLTAEFRVGTAGAPVTGSAGKGGVLKISKTEDLRVADFVNGNTNEQSGAIVAHVKNLSTSEVQANALYVTAETTSTSATSGANRDAMGFAATGRVTGSGTGYGIGGYLVGRRDTDTGKVNALEVRAWNETATNSSYSASTASDMMGIWLSPSGPSGAGGRLTGAAMVIGRVNADAQWDVGIGIPQLSSGSPVLNQTFRDDSNSATSIQINGTHGTAAIQTGATAGPVQVGRTSAVINSGVLFEVYKSGPTTPLAAVQGNAVTDLVVLKVGQSAGSMHIFSAGANDHIVTGSVQGDQGIGFTATKTFHIGRFANTAPLKVSDGLGFFGKTPVTRSTNAITLTNYTVGARSLNRSSYTMNELADVVCELVRQLGDTAGVGLVNDA